MKQASITQVTRILITNRDKEDAIVIVGALLAALAQKGIKSFELDDMKAAYTKIEGWEIWVSIFGEIINETDRNFELRNEDEDRRIVEEAYTTSLEAFAKA